MTEDLKNELLEEAEKRLEKDRHFQQRLEQRNQAMRQEVIKELRALKSIEEKMQRSRNPEVRALVREMVAEAGERGMTIDDLYQGLAGRRGIKGHLSGLMDSNNNLIYVGLLLALLAVPQVRETLRPFMGKFLEEIDALGGKVKSLAAKARESIEDVVAEAQFERLQDMLSADIEAGSGMPEGPENHG